MQIFSSIRIVFEFISKYFKVFVFLLLVAVLMLPKADSQAVLNENANLARVDLYGAIMEAESFIVSLEEYAKNPQIKGILVVIDSPGGAVAPSIEIAEAIKRVNAHKPVVAYAQGSMASGSYWAGLWSQAIVANRGALLGSIGVIIQGADVSELAGKIGIKTQSIKAGIYKEAGTFARAWDKNERGMLEGLVATQYKMFVDEVLQARGPRGLDGAKESEFAQGRVLDAASARKLGLVDEVGGMFEAREILMRLSGVKEPIWYKIEKSKYEVYLEKFLGEKLQIAIENGIKAALSTANIKTNS